MKNLIQHRIIEIEVHQSKKHPKLGHAIALIFPCNHKKYLGITLFKKENVTNNPIFYRTDCCRIIKFEDYELTDKEFCKECPPDEMWIDSLPPATMEDITSSLEAIEDLS